MSPVQSWGHRQYWEVSSTIVAAAAAPGGYPTWQAAPMSLVLGSIFGGVLPFLERIGRALVWGWRMFRIIVRWPPAKRQALEHAIRLMDSPLYVHAVRAVKMTAVLPGFNEPQAWRQVGQKLKASCGVAENTWRHLEAGDAFDKMIRAEGSTTTNPERSFYIELAYQSFGQQAVGSTHT